jgi:hypothetical protein
MLRLNPKPEDDSLHKYRKKIGNTVVDDGYDALHLLIGRAITAWSSIEDELFLCYLIASQPVNVAAFTAAYNTIVLPKNKLDTCNAAMQFYLLEKSELVAEWEKIYQAVSSCLNTRNRIAHFLPVTVVGVECPILSPSHYKINNLTEIVIDEDANEKIQLKGKEGFKISRYTLTDIRDHVARFQQTHLDLAAFINKIRPAHGLVIAHNLDYI